jgi:hypothetical protein
MSGWPGLIGWYGLYSEDANYALVLRFSAALIRDKPEEDILKKAREQFHDQMCDMLEIIDCGDASVDMVPKRAEFAY